MVKIMNSIILTGRISSDVKANYIVKGNDTTSVLSFNLAVVDRGGKKDEDGNYPCDFFRCTTFSLAEVIEKYCSKGDKILVKGKLKNNNYVKEDGSKSYGVEILIDEVEFLETKRKEDTKTSKKK